MKKTLTIIFEKGENELYARIEHEDFLIVESSNNHQNAVKGLKTLIVDFLAHESKESKKWDNLTIEDISFLFKYDLSEFFEVFNSLNISKIAEYAEINPSLMRQYATGLSYPSIKQLKKIEAAINNLGTELQAVKLTTKGNE